MSLQEIYYVAEMVVGLAVIISIIFVAIELRQNTYLLRKSMRDEREQRSNWLMETICTDADFREFMMRVGDDFAKMEDVERFRGISLGIRLVRPMLNELVAYFDGKISPDEFHALEHNIRRAKRRQHIQAAYEWSKAGYPERVQKYWEGVITQQDDVTAVAASAIS